MLMILEDDDYVIIINDYEGNEEPLPTFSIGI